MNPLLEEMIHVRGIEYLIVDQGFRIAHASKGVSRFADDPDFVTVGTDIRMAFPEIVGLENELRAILHNSEGTQKLRGIERSLGSGPSMFISITIEPKLTETGRSNSFLVMLEDITEAMLLEQKAVQQSNEAMLVLKALASSKRYMESIIDSMADALFVTSPDGIIETVNRTASHLFEYAKAELIGQRLELIVTNQILLPGPQNKVSPSDSILFRNREVACKTRSGKEIPISFSCSVVRGENGAIEGFVYLGRDIRERTLAEHKIQKLQIENVYLQEEIKSDHNFEEIIGRSTAIKKVFKQIQKVAGTDSTVLLYGETGTGKELIARAIHNLSPRKAKVLVKVNCASLPSGLVESELFGHEKGAFTGATALRIGRFELADGGTLLMDEVGELPLETQAKLLRILQEQEIERVGGTQTLRIDVRIIAATNRSIQDAVEVGAFREDLFYRLNVFPIHIPALRDREEDIPILSSYFISKFSRKMSKQIEGISEKGLTKLMQYSWPGNVRELANVLERAVILCESGELKETDLAVTTFHPTLSTKASRLEDVQREHILQILKESDGIIEGPRGAASRLGVNPATLRSQIKKLGIQRTGRSFVANPPSRSR